MSDPFCTYRWDRGDSTEPGPCQCMRDGGHDGSHRCCCGNEADDE